MSTAHMTDSVYLGGGAHELCRLNSGPAAASLNSPLHMSRSQFTLLTTYHLFIIDERCVSFIKHQLLLTGADVPDHN